MNSRDNPAFAKKYYFFGGLFPLPPPEGLPVVLGAFGGLLVPLAIKICFRE